MIDTAAKRRMAASFKPIMKAPIPDGTIGKSDRVHIGWAYGGIFVVLDLATDVIRRREYYNLGKMQTIYSLGKSLIKYTLGRRVN